jgi:transposase
MRIVGVTGGVDTHADTHVAAAVDDNGGLLGVESFPATEAGFAELLGWLIGFGSITQIGVEGTGSWGVGLNRFLNDQEVTVVEVDRPNRQQRRKAGKSDPSDAVSAARAALSGTATTTPKSRDGAVEQIRVRFKDRYKTGLVTEAANMRPNKGSDPIVFTTNMVIRSLAQRIKALNNKIKTIDQTLRLLIEETTPSLLTLHGVGIDTAASLLVAAGDNPDRFHSERSWAHLCGTTPLPASSDKVTRHRLNRGGDRQANAALYRIVLTRMSSHPETRTYVTRRKAEGLSTPEIMRCLKRYVARQTYKHLLHMT